MANQERGEELLADRTEIMDNGMGSRGGRYCLAQVKRAPEGRTHMSDDLPREPADGGGSVGDVTVWLGWLQSGNAGQKEQARRHLDERFGAMIKAAIQNRLDRRVRQRIGASD